MKNIGDLERSIRFGIGGALIVSGFWVSGNLRYVLWVLSLLPLLTAAYRFCPLWAFLRINTLPK